MASGNTRVFTGFCNTTAAAATTVEKEALGFRPSYLRMLVGVDVYEWYEGMADDSAVKTAGATGVRTVEAADGFTPLDSGFVFGALHGAAAPAYFEARD